MAAHRQQQRGKVEACLLKLLHRQQLLAYQQWHSYLLHM